MRFWVDKNLKRFRASLLGRMVYLNPVVDVRIWSVWCIGQVLVRRSKILEPL